MNANIYMFIANKVCQDNKNTVNTMLGNFMEIYFLMKNEQYKLMNIIRSRNDDIESLSKN